MNERNDNNPDAIICQLDCQISTFDKAANFLQWMEEKKKELLLVEHFKGTANMDELENWLDEVKHVRVMFEVASMQLTVARFTALAEKYQWDLERFCKAKGVQLKEDAERGGEE